MRLPAAVLVLAVTAPALGVEAPCADIDHRHTAWSGLLQRHVRGGGVDYAAWKRDATAGLARYLDELSAVCAATYAGWTRPQQLAFWLNAYNAFTIRLILDHYPVASIRRIGILPGAAFRRSFIPMPQLDLRGLDRELSLNDVEHRVLRPLFAEPRIHFAIVCASRSCPPLRPEAYRADDLDAQLDDQARAFLADRSKNRVDAAVGTLFLSSIFTWFREDFEAAAGSLPAYVTRYLDDRDAAVARRPDVRIEFLDYDWSLNGT